MIKRYQKLNMELNFVSNHCTEDTSPLVVGNWQTFQLAQTREGSIKVEKRRAKINSIALKLIVELWFLTSGLAVTLNYSHTAYLDWLDVKTVMFLLAYI